jgi:arylsulfatase A-like enzyme
MWKVRVRMNVSRIAGIAGIGVAAAVATAATYQDAPRAGAVSNHVIIVSIDGLRPDAIEAYEAHTLQRLVREGAYSLTAETVYPSKTLPSHTSMLTGLTPEQHGITWNTDKTSAHGVVQVPTIFGMAKAAGFTTAAFFSKSKLRHLQQPGSLDHSQAPRGLDVSPATRTVEDATRYMQFRRPNLMFVHISEPDAAGHSFGWMGSAYGVAVRRADAAVGRIIAAADATYGVGGYTIIVTADHGGHGTHHGSDHEEDMQIPWIAWGAGVEPGALAIAINTTDTAATALWLLGVKEPASFSGTVVASAYTPAARLAARGFYAAP